MQRPKPGETEEDLLKQFELFSKASGSSTSEPSAKLVNCRPQKLTSNDSNADKTEPEKRKISKFAKEHSKKVKCRLADKTVLSEAVKDVRPAVLSRILPRNVPTVIPHAHWDPPPNPDGFPKAPKLNLQNISLNTTGKQSLYMQQMNKNVSQSTVDVEMDTDTADRHLVDILGKRSFVVSEKSGIAKTDADKIHEESMSKLAAMTHDERLKERDELLSKLDPKQIEFLMSIRKSKDLVSKESNSSGGVAEKDKMEWAQNKEIKTEESTQRTPEQTEFKVRFNIAEEPLESEEVIESSLPIPPEEANKWIHMDKVELDKLKWMSDIPKPKALKGKEGYVARFNFDGDLLPYDSDISWREGLHHHGDEPGRAGYSLDELFIFIRSQVLQQRHLGLKTVANILRNAAEGLYDNCFETPIAQVMIDAGVVLLIRFAIDESAPLVFQEALRALYYLVSSEADERCLSVTDTWTPLWVQPGFSSEIHSKEKEREELNKEEKDLKDVEVIKLDVIRALIRMDTLIRLRYLLESVTLSPKDVIHTLSILRRFARHSLTAAWKVFETPRLISVITQHFIPHNISPLLTGRNSEQLQSVYGVPVSHALGLMKVLASRGRHIASKLIENHDLLSSILTYASMEPKIVEMPLVEALSVVQESYCLWSVLLSYGLTKPQEAFTDFYPLIIKQLLFYRDKVDLTTDIVSNHFNYEIGAHFVMAITKALSVAATTTLLSTRMRSNLGSVVDPDGKDVVLRPPILNWSDFNEIESLVEVCVVKWVHQLSENVQEVSFSGYKLVGSFMTFLNVYISKWRDQSNFEGVLFVKKLEEIHNKIFSPLFNLNKSDFFFEKLKEHSALCSSLFLGHAREPSNLGSLGSVCLGGKVTPILQNGSPFPFIYPMTSLLSTLYNLKPHFENDSVYNMLKNSKFHQYLVDVCQSKLTLTEQYFTRIEIYSLVNILRVCSVLQSIDDDRLHHDIAIFLIPLVQKGDEQLIKSLFNLIFEPKYIKDLTEIETQIENLRVGEFKPLKSPAFTQPNLSTDVLTKKLIDSWSSLSQSLVKNLLYSGALEASLVKHNCVPFLTNHLFLDQSEKVKILDHYWVLEPLRLMDLLSESKQNVKNISDSDTIIQVTKWVQMTYFLLKYRHKVFARHTNITGWFLHLSNVFLASNDLFLDADINSYVQAILFEILSKEQYKSLDPKSSIPGLHSFYEWYKRIVGHYVSVGYGDSTFALFIILPLMKSWPDSYKLLLFDEYSEALTFIYLTPENVSQFVPLEAFYSDEKVSEIVLQKFKSAASNQLVSEKRNPFLYQFIMHHIKK